MTVRRGARWGRACAALVLAAAFAGPAAVSAAPARAVAAPVRHHVMVPAPSLGAGTGAPRGGLQSTNWGGYVQGGHAGAFTSVAGCWTVPSVTGGQAAAYSATWVGVDGFDAASLGGTSDGYLIQIGTEQDWYGAPGAQDYAWWELITPGNLNPPYYVETVAPGDSVCASVQRGAGGDWTMSLSDLTSGGAFNVTQPYAGPAESAEWIEEAPYDATSASVLPLADFGQVSFTAARVDGGSADLAAGEAMTLLDAAAAAQGVHQVDAYASAPAGDAFTVTYGSPPGAGPPPQPVATEYTPLTPFRICDTRAGMGTPCSGSPIGAGQSLTVQVSGAVGPGGESVPASATAAVLNVTGIQPTATTFLTLYPAGTAVPTASNLNLGAGAVQANLAVVELGSAGAVSIFNPQGSVDVAVDVEGYFAPPPGGTLAFHPLPPLRICDTRPGTGTACSGQPLGAGSWTEVVVSGCPTGLPSCAASVPGDGSAGAVALNLTATQGTQATFLSVAPPSGGGTCPSASPTFSNVNVPAGITIPNRVLVALGPSGAGGPADAICVFNAAGTVDVLVDLDGWFGGGAGADFYSIPPVRVCDTRSSASAGYTTDCSGLHVGAGQTLTFYPFDELAQTAANPVAIVANVTAVGGSATTYFTLYPAGVQRPTASDLNPAPGEAIPNLTLVQVGSSAGASGQVSLYNAQGTIDAVVDVAGWFQ